MVPTVIATGAVLATIFSLLKPFAEIVVPPKASLHDPALRLLVILLGGIVGLVQAGLLNQLMDGHAVLVATLTGAGEGVTAITLYHLVPGDIFTPPTNPQLIPGPSIGGSAFVPTNMPGVLRQSTLPALAPGTPLPASVAQNTPVAATTQPGATVGPAQPPPTEVSHG